MNSGLRAGTAKKINKFTKGCQEKDHQKDLTNHVSSWASARQTKISLALPP